MITTFIGNFSYKNKYLVEGNLRYDGSSRFAPGNRWGIYPAVSAGWNISEESFFDPVRQWFSDLKLRGSWGKLGNQNITGAYPYITTISSGQNYTFNNTIASGIAPVNGANSNIKWETTQEAGAGLDAGFLSNKITLSTDYFVKNTYDILLSIPVGSAYGLTAPVQNAGKVRNKGWEFELGYHHNTGAFTYDISLNTSFIKNEVTDLKGTGPIISGATFLQVGYPINSKNRVGINRSVRLRCHQCSKKPGGDAFC